MQSTKHCTQSFRRRLLLRLTTAFFLAIFMASSPLLVSKVAWAETTAERIQIGKEIVFRRKGKSGVGNCLACHAIAGGDSPGNMGPPLVLIKQRFPQRDLLRSRIYDATQFNPISAMPPFGKNRILTEGEIEYIIDFLYTL